MKRKRFTQEQINGVLRVHAAGAKASELSILTASAKGRSMPWKARYGGMTVRCGLGSASSPRSDGGSAIGGSRRCWSGRE